MLLSEAIDALAIATRANGRSARTVQSYRQKLRPLLEFLGDVAVDAVTVHDLRGYVVSLRDREQRYSDHPTRPTIASGLSPFTVSSIIQSTKRLFNWLAAPPSPSGP